MGYKIIDNQCGKYFWNGYIFKNKKEIVEALADYHDIDFEDKGNLTFLVWIKKHISIKIKEQLEYLQDYGDWDIEEIA